MTLEASCEEQEHHFLKGHKNKVRKNKRTWKWQHVSEERLHQLLPWGGRLLILMALDLAHGPPLHTAQS